MDSVVSAGKRANVAFLFAGQGSQKPGMGRDLYEASPAARQVLDAVEKARPGTLEQCFSGTKEELSLTKNTQPCVFAVDLACACALRERGVAPAAVAGHSLGEVAALAFTGAFDVDAAARLVSERARLMSACCEEHPGAMRAVLKLDAATVEEVAAKAGEAWPVNYNSPLQTVVAGSPDACERLDALVREAHGRSMAVAVSGAFHTPFMAAATDGLAAYLAANPPQVPTIACWANLTGKPYGSTVQDVAETLCAQVSHPVRWVEVLLGMQAQGIDVFVEVGPGHTLTGLVKHTLTGATTYNVETPDQLEEVVLALGEEA